MDNLTPEQSLSWWTSMEIHRRGGAVIEPKDGYIVVRTPQNPGYHWGNCLLVTGSNVNNGEEWLDTVISVQEDTTWSALLASEYSSDASEEYRLFRTSRVQAQRRLVETGNACWFAAMTPDGNIASSLGIVILDGIARYQSVATNSQHRRRGLARHLLGVASHWAFDQGARTLVIVADQSSDGDRLYHQAGFIPGVLEYNAYISDIFDS